MKIISGKVAGDIRIPAAYETPIMMYYQRCAGSVRSSFRT
jgi:hypothetical protein